MAATNENESVADAPASPAATGADTGAANANGATDTNGVEGVAGDNSTQVEAGDNSTQVEAQAEAEVSKSNGEDAPAPDPIQLKTVTGILAKVKNNTEMSDTDKVDTLCVLISKIIDENNMLKSDVVTMTDHISKASQANDAVKKLNSAYKQQIQLVVEENELKLQEEAVKRAEVCKTYQTTMDELSTLLETHTDQNSRLREENIGMADKLRQLCEEGEKREKQVAGRLKESELQIELLGHQVMKAQLEKAELKADMTKERLEIAQELSLERDRSANLDETVRILKEQAAIYQAQLEDLSSGAGNNTKTFQHFKQQIDKLTQQLVELDKDTHQWREKYEVSSQQVKKMNSQSLEREKEIGQLKKKLDQMVKLNKTLADERTKLNNKIKELENGASS